jgi:CRP-like cAMP-binding protein
MHASEATAPAKLWPELRYRAGDRILAQGDRTSSLFLVRRGVVRLSSVSRDGKEAILAFVGPGGVFGESAFCPGERDVSAATSVCRSDRDPPATAHARHGDHDAPAATAQTDCAISPVPVEALLGHGAVSSILVGLAERVADATADLERLLHHDVRARVAGAVARLADRYGKERDGRIMVELALTQRELASMVGSTRESVSRSLSTLAACGWLRTQPGALEVVHLEAVRRVARDSA